MTVEQSVNQLTVATQALLDAINIKKAGLDLAVANSTTAATTATTQATTATTAAATATTQASAATAAAANAAAIVYSGTSSLTPAAGKIPIATATGEIDPGWIGAKRYVVTLNGDEGVTVTHNRGNTNYAVQVIPSANLARVGEINISSKAANTVVINNSGDTRIAAEVTITPTL